MGTTRAAWRIVAVLALVALLALAPWAWKRHQDTQARDARAQLRLELCVQSAGSDVDAVHRCAQEWADR